MNKRILLLVIGSVLIIFVTFVLSTISFWRTAQTQATTQTAMAALALGDSDNDGLADSQEISLGTNPREKDTDSDGSTDGQEIHVYGTDPRNADTDGDGLTDGVDTLPGSAPTLTPLPTDSGITTLTPITTSEIQTEIPNPTLTLQAAYKEVDRQFESLLKANIAFNKPEKIKLDIPVSIELILNPSVSESALATQLIERGNFVTSTADPNLLLAPSGESVTIETSQIEITPRMKAVLLSQDPEAFTIKELHDSAEQVVSSVETTNWRWSVTAKKEGTQTLELVIYQLIKYDDKEF